MVVCLTALYPLSQRLVPLPPNNFCSIVTSSMQGKLFIIHIHWVQSSLVTIRMIAIVDYSDEKGAQTLGLTNAGCGEPNGDGRASLWWYLD